MNQTLSERERTEALPIPEGVISDVVGAIPAINNHFGGRVFKVAMELGSYGGTWQTKEEDLNIVSFAQSQGEKYLTVKFSAMFRNVAVEKLRTRGAVHEPEYKKAAVDEIGLSLTGTICFRAGKVGVYHTEIITYGGSAVWKAVQGGTGKDVMEASRDE